MALALITNSVLDVAFGVAYWTLKKTGQGIYNLGCYFMGGDSDNYPNDNDPNENQTSQQNENIILMEEIGKLRDEIKDLKESINT